MPHPGRETQVKWFVEGILSILFSLEREVTCMEGIWLIFLLLSIHYIGSVFACFPCSETEAYVSERPTRKLWEPVSVQFGADLDEFLTSFDPVKAYRTMTEISDPSFLLSKMQRRRLRRKHIQALIASAQLQTAKADTEMAALFKRVAFSDKKASQLNKSDITELTRGRSVYFTKDLNELPIVIDTGASMSLSPNRNDFMGDLKAPNVSELHGLSNTTKVVGVGTVKWTVRDLFGVTRVISTQAYYVPEASIRLFSPQTYFQENDAGQLLITARRSELTLSDGSVLEFPYNCGNNLPLMLPKVIVPVGLSFEDTQVLMDGTQLRGLMSVADEMNQNITASQKELLMWHWRLGHAGFQWVQKLATVPRNKEDGDNRLPILKTKTPRVSSCQAPLCTACQLARQTRRGAGTSQELKDPKKESLLKRGNLEPGQMVSIDQYISALPGRLPHTKGKESKKDMYRGGTLFVDHASGYIFLKNQVSLRVGETLRAKRAFEQFAAQHGVRVRNYHADNVPFSAQEFIDHLEQQDQTIIYSGTGAHHQNGVAERAIRTVTSWARAMLLHAVIHWPDQADLRLWPFALEYAIYLWNNIPNRESLMAPLEIFSSSKFPSYDQLNRAHVWGCPVYVLDPKLQDGKKIPKWHPKARRGQFLGVSSQHSSLIGRILNIRTGHVSPQYHVVYDDLFSTVPNAESGGILDTDSFNADNWTRLITSTGSERHVDQEFDERGNRVRLPELHDEWLTPQKQQL
jgi:hypothetical protein